MVKVTVVSNMLLRGNLGFDYRVRLAALETEILHFFTNLVEEGKLFYLNNACIAASRRGLFAESTKRTLAIMEFIFMSVRPV